jgi:hypothetical protein
VRKSFKGGCTNKPQCVCGWNYLYVVTGFGQQANNARGFIGGNAASDAKDNAHDLLGGVLL